MKLKTFVKAFSLFFTKPKEFFYKLKLFIWHLYKLYILRDKHLLEARRWFSDKGDETHRMNHPNLNKNSIVFDLGGYKGDFSADLYKKYGCQIYVFEPNPSYYKICEDRFRDIDNILVLNYGISDNDCFLDLSDSEDGSSTDISQIKENTSIISAEFRNCLRVIKELDIDIIDLMKINIEGGEFPLLQYLADNEKLDISKNYQIQFHNFVENADIKRKQITDALSQTHYRTWCYEFVWENWTYK
jgi:FkbM family methyltransferase